jgi:hypothetical protein
MAHTTSRATTASRRAQATYAGGDDGIAKMWNRKEISVSSYYHQSHYLHPPSLNHLGDTDVARARARSLSHRATPVRGHSSPQQAPSAAPHRQATADWAARTRRVSMVRRGPGPHRRQTLADREHGGSLGMHKSPDRPWAARAAAFPAPEPAPEERAPPARVCAVDADVQVVAPSLVHSLVRAHVAAVAGHRPLRRRGVHLRSVIQRGGGLQLQLRRRRGKRPAPARRCSLRQTINQHD